ncbi:MAG: class I SAM-dependent methyltransferase [Steroidobacteraceae bacterium]|jgi:SAM-dependent methyltransferase
MRAVVRACPVCGDSDTTREMFAERIDPTRLGALSYASRKEPEYMRLRMVVCPTCDLLYAPRVPRPESLARAYAEAGYDTDAEARHAADSYAGALRGRLDSLPDRASALEIGAGNGALLERLRTLGFAELVGIEPSREAARSAPAALRSSIRIECFDPGSLPAAYFTLVIVNQTIEHVPAPLELLSAARRLLKPGGLLMLVSHNYRHWLMRFLGARSPIIDIEHLQIFSPSSLAAALRRAGFQTADIKPFTNEYPMHYWARLLPIPPRLKRPLQGWLRRSEAVGGLILRASVGNIVAWARASCTM